MGVSVVTNGYCPKISAKGRHGKNSVWQMNKIRQNFVSVGFAKLFYRLAVQVEKICTLGKYAYNKGFVADLGKTCIGKLGKGLYSQTAIPSARKTAIAVTAVAATTTTSAVTTVTTAIITAVVTTITTAIVATVVTTANVVVSAYAPCT